MQESRRLLLLQLLRAIITADSYSSSPGSGDRLLLNRGNCLLTRSFLEPIQLPFDGLNLDNDLGDDFPLIQARKERCRIGQNSSCVMEAV